MLASPVADEAEVLKRLAPPVWVEDKYDGIRAQLHKQGDEVRLYSRDLHDISDGYPGGHRAAAGPAVGRHPRRRGAGLARRHGAAVHPAPAAPRAARTRAGRCRRRCPSSTSPSTCSRLERAAARAVEPLLTLPLRERRARLDALRLPDVPGMASGNLLTASTDARSCRTSSTQAQERGNEGLMVKDPDSDLHARPARLRLAQAQATVDHARLRRRGRRGGPWQAPRRAVRLHLRGARRPTGRRRSPGHDRQGVQRPDRRGDRRDDGLVPGAHARADRSLPRRRAHGRGRDRVRRDPPLQPPRLGFALRFPRIFRLRHDKDAREIDTITNVETLFRRLESGRRFSVQTHTGAAPPA